ncbi:membrane dipeptidase-domain-containing protein [Massariosphaeria phaeospora]|uniref:Dipeptidase n=1 Tax=Massariosphaeria phaeospora TaxID=100035 RepID=A0A7C8IQZ9_9PLEO|nr:membrane dipeptidase-domain-containing protein [Massariosphaeria phaeospora]
MIDLSHTSHKVMHEVLDLSVAPVLYTHSSCFALVPSARNVPDEVIEKVKHNGGLIMISLVPHLTHTNSSKANAHHVVDHMEHVADRIGFNHVGIGSDYDGMENGVVEVEDVSKLPNLVACMISRGMSEENVGKILGGNLIRVMEGVEVAAEQLRAESVLEDTVKPLWDEQFRDWVRSLYPNAEKDRRQGKRE